MGVPIRTTTSTSRRSCADVRVPRVLDVDLGPRVAAWFTGRASGPDPGVGRAGNLSARRPHQPDRLAADRQAAFGRHGVEAADVHLLHQVHDRDVAVVDEAVAPGTELPASDGAVTAVPGRALAVLTADCLPVLLAGPHVVGAVHAGRRGLVGGVLASALDACTRLGDPPEILRAVIGPAIHACCYEVPADLRDEVAARRPVAAGTTSWGTPSLDLPGAAAAELDAAGVDVRTIDVCTRCRSDVWFSHRADPGAGRQAGVVVRLPDERVVAA